MTGRAAEGGVVLPECVRLGSGEMGEDLIRLFLVDDHALFRQGLAGLLRQQPDFEVVGLAGTAEEGLSGVGAGSPDLVLLDVDLGKDRAIDFLTRLRNARNHCPVLLVTAGISDVEAVALIREGVHGIFHKHAAPEALFEAIRGVAAGDVYLEPKYLRGVLKSMDRHSEAGDKELSEREVSVLRMLLQGLANKEMAERLGLSESSVKAVLRGMFDRLGVRTRSQLVKIALEEYANLL